MENKCEFCDKEILNKGSLKKHEYSCKKNPNRIVYTSNFIEYNKYKKNNNIKGTNQYIKAKLNGLEVPKMSDETKNKISEHSKKQIWDDARKLKHSTSMKNAVKKNPDSYSHKNVSGRVKTIKYKDFYLKGQWELLIAMELDKNNINWTNKFNGFEYAWNDNIHLYFPDFYLSEYDIYIEVKGYETDRDKCKWLYFPKKLLILKKCEIQKIQKMEISIKEYINSFIGPLA